MDDKLNSMSIMNALNEDSNSNIIQNLSRLSLSEQQEVNNIITEQSTVIVESQTVDVNKNHSNTYGESSNTKMGTTYSNARTNSIVSNSTSAKISSRRTSSETVGEYRSSTRPTSFQIPIIGYEVMEERARFTIFKLRIDDPRTGLSWMVFRRYTDFVRLYSKLKDTYPQLSLPLPGKRLFKDNFEPAFLDERVRGLQLFINVVVRNISMDSTVRDFFCLDEPPPVCDSEPESLALFGALEDTVVTLKNQLRQKDETIDYMKKKIIYFEDKMRECKHCNPWYDKYNCKGSPGTSGSSNCS